MKETINKLIELQRVMKRIFDLEQKNVTLPLKLEKYKKKLAIVETSIFNVNSNLAELESQLQKNELAVSENNDRRTDINSKKDKIETEKEAEALATEENNVNEKEIALKNERSDIERKIQIYTIRLNGQEETDNSLQKQKDVLVETITSEESKLDEKVTKNKTKMDKLKEKESVLAPDVEPGLLKKFTRILKNKNGLAVTPIVEDSCQGCHMIVPPQVITDVRKGKDLVYCLHCSRILYIDEV